VFALVACSSSAAPSDPSSLGAEAPESQSAAPIASATSRTADFASPSTTPLMSAPRITWSEVQFDGYIADIIGDGDRFVAVGAGSSGTSAWTSPDGMSWEQHDVPEQSFGQFPNGADITAGMRSLVRLGGTLYSFGATPIGPTYGSNGAGWRWTDGQAWEAIHSNSEFFRGEVIAVTASDHALVASTVIRGDPRSTLATWRWTPATSWVRTSLPSDIPWAFAWADGTFLAVGSSVVAASTAQPSMWISADGIDWRSVGTPDGMSSVCAFISTAAGGFVAFGRAGDRIGAWTSTDGATWVESTVEHADASGITDDTLSAAPCSVVAADDGLVAVMQVDDALIWTSRDGVSWEFQEELEVSGVRVAGDVLLAAVGRHVLLADTRSDPTDPDGLRQVVFVGVVEP
jgi:hypothetical protein